MLHSLCSILALLIILYCTTNISNLSPPRKERKGVVVIAQRGYIYIAIGSVWQPLEYSVWQPLADGGHYINQRL